jgi:flagellar protein FlaG
MSMSSVNAAGLGRVASAERIARPAPAADRVVEQAKAPTSPAPEVPAAAMPRRDLEAATAQIERYMRSSGRDLQFRVDDDSGRVVVSVRDSGTGELIRQIPSEAALRIAKSLEQGAAAVDSLLIEDKA